MVNFRLMLAPGINGAEGETSKLKSKDLPATRVAVKLVMGSVDTFLRVISTVGPPGVIGGMGPVTDIIPTDWICEPLLHAAPPVNIITAANMKIRAA